MDVNRLRLSGRLVTHWLEFRGRVWGKGQIVRKSQVVWTQRQASVSVYLLSPFEGEGLLGAVRLELEGLSSPLPLRERVRVRVKQ